MTFTPSTLIDEDGIPYFLDDNQNFVAEVMWHLWHESPSYNAKQIPAARAATPPRYHPQLGDHIYWMIMMSWQSCSIPQLEEPLKEFLPVWIEWVQTAFNVSPDEFERLKEKEVKQAIYAADTEYLQQ